MSHSAVQFNTIGWAGNIFHFIITQSHKNTVGGRGSLAVYAIFFWNIDICAFGFGSDPSPPFWDFVPNFSIF